MNQEYISDLLHKNTTMGTEKKTCENCQEWERLKHDKDPWLIYCPTCGRKLKGE